MLHTNTRMICVDAAADMMSMMSMMMMDDAAAADDDDRLIDDGQVGVVEVVAAAIDNGDLD